MYVKPSLLGETATALMAGVMASSMGSAMAAPIPCNRVRLDRAFLVINMLTASAFQRLDRLNLSCLCRPDFQWLFRLDFCLKGHALYNAQYQ